MAEATMFTITLTAEARVNALEHLMEYNSYYAEVHGLGEDLVEPIAILEEKKARHVYQFNSVAHR